MRIIDTRLVLGGPADGERWTIAPGVNTWAYRQPGADRTSYYNRQTIAGDSHGFLVWVLSSMPTDEAMASLLLRYPDPRADELTRTVDFSKVELPEAFR